MCANALSNCNSTPKVENLFIRELVVRKVLLTRQPLYFLYYNYLCFSTSHDVIPYLLDCLLEEFDNVFSKELPHGLPHFRDIEQHFDLIPSAALPKVRSYRNNPKQTK